MDIETSEEQQSVSDSQITDDSALKNSQSGRSSSANTEASSLSEESSKFVKRESRHVFYLRVIVLSILFSISAAISLVVYFITDAGEENNFESQYYAAADKVTGMVDSKKPRDDNIVFLSLSHPLWLTYMWQFDRGVSQHRRKGTNERERFCVHTSRSESTIQLTRSFVGLLRIWKPRALWSVL